MENRTLVPHASNDDLFLNEALPSKEWPMDTQKIALAFACQEVRQKIGDTTPKSFSGNSDPSYLLNAMTR